MKRILSKVFKYSLFNDVVRLVMTLLFLFIVVDVAAESTTYYDQLNLTIGASNDDYKGLGKVYILEKSSGNPGNSTVEGSTTYYKTAGEGYESSYTFNYGIKLHPIGNNSFFNGWKEVIECTANTKESDITKYTKDIVVDEGAINVGSYCFTSSSSATSSDNRHIAKVTAKFDRIIHITTDGVGFDKDNPDSPYKGAIEGENGSFLPRDFEILLQKGESFNVPTISRKNGGVIQISAEINKVNSDWKLQINPIEGQIVEAATYDIIIECEQGGKITFECTLNMESPKILLHVNALGSYNYKKGNNQQKPVPKEGSDIEEELKVSADYTIAFSLGEINENYKFLRWKIIDKDGVVKYNYAQETNISFVGGEEVYLELVEKNRAIFIVRDYPSTKYADLQEAIDDAKKKTKVVIVESSGKLVQGNYTIDDGVTLLVPESEEYIYTMGDIASTHVTTTNVFTEYRRLEIAANTTITVSGEASSIVVASKLFAPNGGHEGAGRPTRYGHIVMGEKSQIIVENEGLLHVLGYITGDPTSGIVLRNTSTLYESFQFNDWLGGTNMLLRYQGSYNRKAFPVEQYYVQNIEIPLHFEYGAEEYVASSVIMSEDITPMNSLLIGADNSGGLFCLKPGLSFVRAYDPTTDRIRYEFSNSQNTLTELNFNSVSMDVGGTALTSSNYILPITNNMEIFVNAGIKVVLNNPMAFLPGCIIKVASGAEVHSKVDTDCFIYDADEKVVLNGSDYVGYFGTGNSKLLPLSYRPGGMLKTRKDSELDDAKIEINGAMYIYGNVYTTLGGANITSTTGGKIYVYNLGNRTTTSQFVGGRDEKEIPLSSTLKLHNNTTQGALVEYTDVIKPTGQDLKTNPLVYSYVVQDGTWHLPKAGISSIKLYDSENKEVTSTYVINLPSEEFDGYLLCELMQVEGLTYQPNQFTAVVQETDKYFTLDDITISADKKSLRIPITYITQGIHGLFENTIQITTNIAGYDPQTTSQKIQMNEDYKPEFSVTTDQLTFLQTSVGTPQSSSLGISYESTNILSLTSGPAATTSKQGNNEILTGNSSDIVWSAMIDGQDADEFMFEYGDAKSNFETAKVTFLATEEYSSTPAQATLHLTARYTDKDGGEAPSVMTKVIALTAYSSLVTNTLKYANFPSEIYPETEKFELLKDKNSSGEIEIVLPTSEDIVKITVDAEGRYWVKPMNIGEVDVHVVQHATSKYARKDLGKITIIVQEDQKIEVRKDDPICVNQDNFLKLTVEKNSMDYTENQLVFDAYSSWKLYFEGIGGSIRFTPQETSIWTVEESSTNALGDWVEIVAMQQYDADIPVELPLSPTTKYVRISTTTGGTLSDLCIYALTINISDDKIYMPYYRNASPASSSKDVTIIYSSDEPLTLQVSDERIGLSAYTLAATATYARETITITSEVASQGEFDVKILSGAEVVCNLPIYTHLFPQPLPLNTQTWEDEHIYFYHLVQQKHVEWDLSSKQFNFLNPGNDLSPRSLVLGFYGYPDFVQFESQSTTWKVQYSTTGADNSWYTATTNTSSIVGSDKMLITAEIPTTSNFLKITYDNSAVDVASISNLLIKGSPSVNVISPYNAELVLTPTNEQDKVTGQIRLRVTNLSQMLVKIDNTQDFQITHKGDEIISNNSVLDFEDYSFLTLNESGEITFTVTLLSRDMVNEGNIQIYDNETGELLSTIRLLGKKDLVTYTDANTGIYTGVRQGYNLVGENFQSYSHHEVNIINAFDQKGTPLFDYLFIYGETTTIDGQNEIITPTRTHGSNAKTPYYVYRKKIAETEMGYEFVEAIENANVPTKNDLHMLAEIREEIKRGDNNNAYAIKPVGQAPLNVYFTGFCPYATTGSSKDEEGVWYFRGDPGQILNIYLEDCHIYSRNKSVDGRTTTKKDVESPKFEGTDVVFGSGAVLVFENSNSVSGGSPFNVTIHTRGNNLLKSNFGCYYELLPGAEVTQVSSPVQIRLGSEKGGDYEFGASKVTLNFDDVWPYGEASGVLLTKRTNGFLSLRKLVNNAPSIDLGNANTIVNFNGGQIELQNAEIVSPNYKTTLAISYRSGEFGNFKEPFAFGLGTDAVGGTVNFNDGTTTVIPMEVDAAYRSFYLMDTEQAKDEAGNLMYDESGKPIMIDLNTTSCLRCPTNTFVHGGSHCMIRACAHVTSKGGAPKDNQGKALGRYIYQNTKEQGYTYDCIVAQLPADFVGYGLGDYVLYDDDQDGKYHKWQVQTENGSMVWKKGEMATFTDPCYIVQPNNFPGQLKNGSGQLLSDYYKKYPNQSYGLQSTTPDQNGKLYFWIPEGYVEGVTPEQDKQITVWKACMTEISAGAMSLSGTIGGKTPIEDDEEVKNLLYCQLDEDIYNVISDHTVTEGDDGETISTYHYKAPVVDPTGQLSESLKYQRIAPMNVGPNLQEEVTANVDYEITNKVYYITTAMADTWMNFTMPFDVEKIWIVESYPEQLLQAYYTNVIPSDDETKLQATKRYQAQHNADFAAFFGVAMALGADHLNFEDIYHRYLDWAKNRADAVYRNEETGEEGTGLYTGGDYTLRGKYQLTHYDGSNFNRANFYLYKNTGDWIMKNVAEDDQDPEYEFTTQWQIVPKVDKGAVLMEKGQTYSMLFPFCQGCDVVINDAGVVETDEQGFPVQLERDYWDYWSGKFIIFESTAASVKEPHVIKGANYIAHNQVENSPWLFDNFNPDPASAMLLGNSTFANLTFTDENGEIMNELMEQIYVYRADRGFEQFTPYTTDFDEDGNEYYPMIPPASTFLLTGASSPIKLIARNGRVILDNGNNSNQNGTSGHMPTVGGGNDLFITSIAGGINVVVAAPQLVRVLSSTGAVIYSGYVTTAVDIQLPTTGIYIVSGENEVQKILF